MEPGAWNVVVGAPGLGAVGSVYVYSDALGVTETKLTPSDGALGDQFGLSVAVSGSTTVVGAPLHDNQTGAAIDTTASTLVVGVFDHDGCLFPVHQRPRRHRKSGLYQRPERHARGADLREQHVGAVRGEHLIRGF